MSDAYSTTGSVNSVQAAFDRYAYFPLRAELLFQQVADVKPTEQSMPGSSVKFTKYTDMSVATSALNESVDVDAVAVSDGQVTLTLVEQGNAVVTTAKLRYTSFQNIPKDVANLVGYNAGVSFDTLARTPLAAGSNVVYANGGTARNQLTTTNTLKASDVRRVNARLRSNEAQRWEDGYFRAFIHPDTSYDLRAETGAAAWRDPHTYSQPGEIWRGDVGAFEGFAFIETSRAPIVADAGSSTTFTDVYQTLFCGRQALAKAYAPEVGPMPTIVHGEVTDKLKRFQPIGWYWLGAFGRFREEALYRVESVSTIGANSTSGTN